MLVPFQNNLPCSKTVCLPVASWPPSLRYSWFRLLSPRTPCAARAWPRGAGRRLPWPGWVFGSTQAQGAQPSALAWGRPRTLDRPQWALPEADGLWVHIIHEHQLFISVTWRGCLVNKGSKRTPGTSCVGPSSFLQRKTDSAWDGLNACLP